MTQLKDRDYTTFGQEGTLFVAEVGYSLVQIGIVRWGQHFYFFWHWVLVLSFFIFFVHKFWWNAWHKAGHMPLLFGFSFFFSVCLRDHRIM